MNAGPAGPMAEMFSRTEVHFLLGASGEGGHMVGYAFDAPAAFPRGGFLYSDSTRFRQDGESCRTANWLKYQDHIFDWVGKR